MRINPVHTFQTSHPQLRTTFATGSLGDRTLPLRTADDLW
jgi:hypothetical protein